MLTLSAPSDVERILNAEHPDPFSFLGMHRAHPRGLVVRVFLPWAKEVTIVEVGEGASCRYPTSRVHAEGFFEATIPDREEFFAYCVQARDGAGEVVTERDPYSFWPTVSSYDQHLFNEGTHSRAYEFLGAHVRELGGVAGVHFAVWAPNAARVSVLGDFNHWDGRRHPMRSLGSSGIWEIFLPHLAHGTLYKYEIRSEAGGIQAKSDPLALGAEVPPRTASMVCDLNRLEWGDQAWMDRRAKVDWRVEPMAIYEVHAGSWRRGPGEDHRQLSYRELADQLIDYVVDMGYTHIELMPISEHPFDGSWGYQVTGYFAPTSRHGSPDEFAHFVNRCHERGIGVIVDWVPGHFPSDGHGLARFDGTCLYEHEDPRQGWHPDWGTLVFNFGRSEVRSFLLSNAAFWLDYYHIDGLRVDAVASMLYLDYSRTDGRWIPNKHGGRENLEAIELLTGMNTLVYGRFPGAVTIAEESTAWPAVSRPTYAGGLGFGYKWNMGWMNDVLRYMSRDSVHRKHHHADLTFGMLYAHQENFILPLSHDEVVHGKRSLLEKMPGDAWRQFANLRLLLAYMYGHPGKKLLFMGGDMGVRQEWDYRGSLDWGILDDPAHRGIQHLVRDLNRLYGTSAALHAADHEAEGFEWIDCQDVDQNVVAFCRRATAEDGELVFICNFAPVVRRGYRVGLPRAGAYAEVLNTDAEVYGGSGVGNAGRVLASEAPWHSQPHSAVVSLPPLAVLVLSPQG